MSVIIEGFKKPKNCYSCPFNNSNCWCVLTDGGYIDRDDWSCSAICPIKELPKGHGRLVDADKVSKEMLKYHDDCAKTSEYTRLGFETAMGVIAYAPTIIEADKAESEE